MKIIFMGTPQIAVPTLEKLINSRHEVIAIITQPDQKSGRGMNIKFSPVKEIALKYGIELIQPEKINNEKVLDYIESLKPEIFVVVAYAQKIPNRILEMGKYGCINLHPSLIPKYRGATPIRGPILYGDEVTGITIMKVIEKWDAGDILLQEIFPLDKKETVATLEPKLAARGAEMMLDAVNKIEAGTITPIPQNSEEAIYLKMIDKETGRIHFEDSAVQIERQIRACDPWPSAFTTLEGKTFKIWDADVTGYGNLCEFPDDTPVGTIVFADKHHIVIKTGEGFIKPNVVQLEGKKRMTMDEFLRGKKLEAGVVFGQ